MKEQILKTARQQICQYGYQSISIRSITKSIGCSPGIVYLYFKNKNDLIKHSCYKFEEDFFDKLCSQNKCDCPVEYLKKICFHCLSYSIQNPKQYELIFYSKEIFKTSDSQSLAAELKIKNICKSIIVECHERGYFSINQDPEDLFQVLWNFMYGLINLNMNEKLINFQKTNQNLSSEILENFIENLFFNRRAVQNISFKNIHAVVC